ncbi:MAG: MFS transporter [Pseudomonadota bacterium]
MSDVQTAGTGAIPLSSAMIYTHGSLGLPLAVIGYPLAIWIPAHYSGGLGLSLAAIGTILMLARLTDVITDPIMGELSDRWRTPFGRRKPWIIAGAPMMMLGVYHLFIPSGDVGLLYFLFWLALFFLGSTMIVLPHRAWGAELSNDYHQRSRITAAREFYVLMGLMVAATVPMIVEVMADLQIGFWEVFPYAWNWITDFIGLTTSAEVPEREAVSRSVLTGPVLAGLAWTIIVVLPLCATAVLMFVKEPPPAPVEKIPLKEGIRYIWRNGMMRRVLLIVLLVHFGEAFRNAVSLFFIRDIIGVTGIGSAYFVYFIAGLAAIPFWLWLGRTIGKHRAFCITMITVGLVSFANFFLEYGDNTPFFLLFFIKGFCFGGLQFLPLAMMADVVDIDSVRSGGRRAGAYFAIMGMTEKLAVAFGTGFSLNIVGLMGFDPSGGVAASSDVGVLTLRVVYTMGPVVFFGAALWLTWFYPLTPERHERIRDRLSKKMARIEARKAASG